MRILTKKFNNFGCLGRDNGLRYFSNQDSPSLNGEGMDAKIND